MQSFKMFRSFGLKKDENIEEKINEWLNEKPQKEILKINESIYPDGHLTISILYST